VVNLIGIMAAGVTQAPWQDLRWRTLTLTDLNRSAGDVHPATTCR
jgi:hypothetical protein